MDFVADDFPFFAAGVAVGVDSDLAGEGGGFHRFCCLATDLEIQAELIALIYRYRWQIELFLKWLKSILGCRHLMAESPEGVAIQIYSALMLQLLTGKRAMELIRFYLMGCAELEESWPCWGWKSPAK